MKRFVALYFLCFGVFAMGVELQVSNETSPSQSFSPAFLVEDFGAVEEPSGVNCLKQPGLYACNNIRRFRGLLQECTGTACYFLWDEQLRLINSFRNFYYSEFPYEAKVASDLERIAKITAIDLCGVRLTGPAEYVNRLAVAYNQFVDILREIQEFANNPVPYSCKFEITNP